MPLTSEGYRAITLGEWLDLVGSHGWADERAWLIVRDCARRALPAVRRRLRPGEDEELVAEIVVLARCVPTTWSRPDRRGIGLVPWLAGVMKRHLLALRRAELPTAGDRIDDLEARDPVEPDELPPRPLPDVDVAALLTVKQLAAW